MKLITYILSALVITTVLGLLAGEITSAGEAAVNHRLNTLEAIENSL